MTLTKQEVIERFCKISSEVNEAVYGWNVCSDCFCGDFESEDYRFDEEVLRTIECAVEEAIDKIQAARQEGEE